MAKRKSRLQCESNVAMNEKVAGSTPAIGTLCEFGVYSFLDVLY